MLLTELYKGDRAMIRRIQADPELRQRLHSFGVIPGEMLEVKGCSLARHYGNRRRRDIDSITQRGS